MGRYLDKMEPPKGVPNNQQVPPHFSFEHLHPDYDLRKSKADDDVLAAFLKKILALGRMTWDQIQHSSKSTAGTENIPARQLPIRMPTAFLGRDAFTVFRLKPGSHSVFGGVREGRVFHICWIDPKGSLYKH